MKTRSFDFRWDVVVVCLFVFYGVCEGGGYFLASEVVFVVVVVVVVVIFFSSFCFLGFLFVCYFVFVS